VYGTQWQRAALFCGAFPAIQRRGAPIGVVAAELWAEVDSEIEAWPCYDWGRASRARTYLAAIAFMLRGVEQMSISDFGRYALCLFAAAALLSGCGGSQPPIGAPGAIPQSSRIATHGAYRRSGLRPAYGSIKSTMVQLSYIPSGITGVGSAIYAVEHSIFTSGNGAVAYINNWKLVSETSNNEDLDTGGLTAGPDHKLYFPFLHNFPSTLGTFDTKTKKFSQIKVTNSNLDFYGGAITTASDGTIWNVAAVAYNSNDDCYVEHTLNTRKSIGYLYITYEPSYDFSCHPQSIIVGPDSRLWWPSGGSYQEASSGSMSPPVYAMTSSGTLSRYTIPTTKQGSSYITRQLENLVPASDGNLWAAVQLTSWSGSTGAPDGCEILSISTSGKVKEHKVNNTALTNCPNGLAVDKAGFLWMPAYIPTSSYVSLYLVRLNPSGQMTIFKFSLANDYSILTGALPFVDKAGYIYYGYQCDCSNNTGGIVRFKPQDAK
jgi:hypothetical protein